MTEGLYKEGGINGSFMMRYPPERSGWMSGAGKRLIFSLF